MSSCSVKIQVADHLGRLDIVDGSFRSVASGFDSVQADLAPGLYKARASINIAHSEELFIVEPSSERLTLTLAPPRFTTPAPLQDTAFARDDQQRALTQATQRRPVDAQLGEGATLLLCVRDVRDKCGTGPPGDVTEQERAAYRESFGEFSLHDRAGNHLLHVSQHAQPDVERGILIFHVALHPGYYLLSIRIGDGEYLELPLPACRGWRSSLYLQMRPPHCLEQAGHPDLMERALLFEPMEQAFDPTRRDLRMTEMTRLALLRSREVRLPEQLHAVLRKQVVNPGILLFGAYLLLAETQCDHGLLRHTVDLLAELLGPAFPDVVALRLELAHINHAALALPQAGVSLPPLLRASWKLLAEHPQIFTPGSLAHHVGTQFMASGPWLTWRVLETPDRPPPRNVGPVAAAAVAVANAAVSPNVPITMTGYVATTIPLLAALQGWVGKSLFPRRIPKADVAPADEAQTTLAASKQAAQMVGILNLAQWKAGASGRAVLNRLTRLQKALLPVLQLIEVQRTAGDDFTMDELKQLQQQLGVTMPVLRETLEDLLDKLKST